MDWESRTARRNAGPETPPLSPPESSWEDLQHDLAALTGCHHPHERSLRLGERKHRIDRRAKLPRVDQAGELDELPASRLDHEVDTDHSLRRFFRDGHEPSALAEDLRRASKCIAPN